MTDAIIQIEGIRDHLLSRRLERVLTTSHERLIDDEAPLCVLRLIQHLVLGNHTPTVTSRVEAVIEGTHGPRQFGRSRA